MDQEDVETEFYAEGGPTSYAPMAYKYIYKARRITRRATRHSFAEGVNRSGSDMEKQNSAERHTFTDGNDYGGTTQSSGRTKKQPSGEELFRDSMSDASANQQAPLRSKETSLLIRSISKSDLTIFWEEMVMSPDKRAVNALLLAVPFALWAALAGWADLWVFTLNFLAMVPLAALLGDFTEVAAAHVGQTVGGLLNATFGNAVEVVVSIQALRDNQIRVVQASMMGSVLSNLLLVLGSCFFFGGITRKEQVFNQTAAKANCTLLLLSGLTLVLPTPLGEYYDLSNDDVLVVSRTVSVALLFMYCQLLWFQLKTHKDLFEDEEEEEDEEDMEMSMAGSIVGLTSVTAVVALFSGFLVDSIDGFTEQANLSKTFVGIILLPIIGNVVEHIAAVTVAMKGKMELAMGIACGSGTQVSIFVIPATVVIGWAMGREMTLLFPTFEIGLYIMSVLIVAHAVGQGSSNWLFGSMLITTYCLVGVAFWFENVKEYTDNP